MKYVKISKNSSKYVSIIYLFIAILLNIFLLILTILSDIFLNGKYTLTLNFLFLTINICIYIWAFLISTIIIKNYRYAVTQNKIEVISGALIISRKIMLVNRVYKIEIKRRIIGRIFKVANIKFYSSGGSIRLNYVDYMDVNNLEETVRKGMKVIYGR